MSQVTDTDAEQRLEQLKGEFDHWRQTRRSLGERIPEALWTKAVELSRVLPTARVAKPLRLSQTTLRDRRLGKTTPSPPAPSAANPAVQFVELPNGTPPPSSNGEAGETISVELERADGVRLRLRCRQATALDALISRFLA